MGGHIGATWQIRLNHLSVCGRDVVSCQITLTTCYCLAALQYHVLQCMRPIVTDRVAWSVSLSVTQVSPANTAKLIKMLFGLWTRVSQGNQVLDGVQIPHGKGQF